MNTHLKELALKAGFIGDKLDNTVMGTTYDKALENFATLLREQWSDLGRVEDQKEIWYVENNSDLTEGRGVQYKQLACEKQSTALRMSHRAGIQGCDARSVKGKAFKIDNAWYYQGWLYSPSTEDMKREKELEELARKKAAQEEVLSKAKDLGLSEEEIAILKG